MQNSCSSSFEVIFTALVSKLSTKKAHKATEEINNKIRYCLKRYFVPPQAAGFKTTVT